MRRSSKDRFFLSIPHRPLRGCWVWQGRLNRDGYGVFKIGQRQYRAHKWWWEQVNGPVPNGLELDHLCRNRACVRPSHLEAVTHKVNVHRSPRFIEQMARTHCPAGHRYTPSNTAWNGNKRKCRACQRAAARRWYLRKTQNDNNMEER